MPDPAQLRQFVDRYCEAASSDDVNAYVALFADGAVQRDPASQPPKEGKGAIRAFRQSAVDASSSMDFKAMAVHTCGDQVAIDFHVVANLGNGSMTIEGVEVFTLDDRGLIREVSAYWDEQDVRIE